MKNCDSGKCLFGEISVRGKVIRGTVHWGNIRPGNFPFGELPSENCPLGKCWGNGENVRWGTVHRGKVRRENVHWGTVLTYSFLKYWKYSL